MEMSSEAQRTYDRIVADPGRALFALDFDGVLSPIVDDPDAAVIAPDSLKALERLGGLAGHLAIVTGRPARAAVELGGFLDAANLDRLIVRGQYGVETWEAATKEFDIPPVPEEIEAFAADLDRVLSELGLSGAGLEHKQRAIGIHTRRMPDPQGAFKRLVDPVNELAKRHGLHVEPGRMVLEVRKGGVDKGSTLRELVAQTAATNVVYIGDDLGDVPAFREGIALRSEGVGVLLIQSASAEQEALAELADVAVDGPAGVSDWLHHICERIESGRSESA